MNEMTAQEWNDKYSVGQLVHLTDDDGNIEHTHTRSIAWNLGHGAPVIKVENRTGGYLLSRIQVVDED